MNSDFESTYQVFHQSVGLRMTGVLYKRRNQVLSTNHCEVWQKTLVRVASSLLIILCKVFCVDSHVGEVVQHTPVYRQKSSSTTIV